MANNPNPWSGLLASARDAARTVVSQTNPEYAAEIGLQTLVKKVNPLLANAGQAGGFLGVKAIDASVIKADSNLSPEEHLALQQTFGVMASKSGLNIASYKGCYTPEFGAELTEKLNQQKLFSSEEESKDFDLFIGALNKIHADKKMPLAKLEGADAPLGMVPAVTGLLGFLKEQLPSIFGILNSIAGSLMGIDLNKFLAPDLSSAFAAANAQMPEEENPAKNKKRALLERKMPVADVYGRGNHTDHFNTVMAMGGVPENGEEKVQIVPSPKMPGLVATV